jgi:hypothetical protein
MRTFVLLLVAVDLTACGEMAGVVGLSEGDIDSGHPSDASSIPDGGIDSGHAGDASSISEGGPCVGSVTFRMQTTSPSQYWANFGIDFYDQTWLWIATADGAPVGAYSGRAVGTCSYCEPCAFGGSCGPAGPVYLPVPPDGGITGSWNGSAYTSLSTCVLNSGGAVSAVSCAASSCMPPGEYVATMCASSDPSSPEDAGTCLELPFQYPTASEVVGTLPNYDAGP